MARCGSCGAEIVWLKHAKTGKPAPINITPDPGGPIVIDTAKGTYSVVSPREMPGFRAAYPETVFYTNHFQTCPQAKAWAKHGGKLA